MLYEVPRAVEFIGTGSGLGVARGSGRRECRVCVNGCRISVVQDEKVLVMDGGDDCKTM